MFTLVCSYTCMAESLKMLPVLSQHTDKCSYFFSELNHLSGYGGHRSHTAGRDNVTIALVSFRFFVSVQILA